MFFLFQDLTQEAVSKMSFLKFWNSSSSSSSGKKTASNNSKQQSAPSKQKENSQPSSSQNAANKEDFVFDDESIPFKGRKDGRNLSISRSGRHKVRGRQRSVISGELYAGAEGADNTGGASGESRTTSHPNHCRDNSGGVTTGGSMSTSSQPTAV